MSARQSAIPKAICWPPYTPFSKVMTTPPPRSRLRGLSVSPEALSGWSRKPRVPPVQSDAAAWAGATGPATATPAARAHTAVSEVSTERSERMAEMSFRWFGGRGVSRARPSCT
ncbi:hypothetical protein SBADM41S_09777 [Streptomyces badius]